MLKNWYVAYLSLFLLAACHSSRHTAAVTTREKYRPVYHFTPPQMWMNDPNGMVYYEGEYHLFYQFYPEKTVWGPMHWGHAVSKDLMHWEHLPMAMYPDSLGLIFSGSAVVDWKNTSGFGKNGKPPLVAIFTHHLMEGERAGRHDFQYQSIAYSNDKGRTWTKYKGNPVIPNVNKVHDFRDPHVIWHGASKQWIMVFAAFDQVQFWASPDLKNWKHLSDFGKEWGNHKGVWECPDIFPMTIAGSTETKWVLLQSINPGGPSGGSATQYFVGDFDGKMFQLDPVFAEKVKNGNAVWVDWGRDNYAGVTWSDVPASDGRRIFLGWMSNWDYATVVPTASWRSAMTLPRELTLVRESAGFQLYAQPVRETQKIRGKSFSLLDKTISGVFDLGQLSGIAPGAMEMVLEVDMPSQPDATFTIELSNRVGETYQIGFDAGRQAWFSDRTHSGNLSFSDKFATQIHWATTTLKSNTRQLHLFFDVASCELFADGGRVALTDIYFPTEEFSSVKLVAKNGEVKIKKVAVFEML